jgi:4-methyl-5(b-hydroxyethyl)-thiazole monophosphate biosynthesis
MKKIAILLEDGFEEIEAIVPIDVLRRLEFDVILAGKTAKVAGAHNIHIDTDSLIEELKADELDAVILPGGLPGSTNLRDNPVVIELISSMYNSGKLVSAICAAPIALQKAGIMNGKVCTGYPMPMLKEALSDAEYTGERVEVDGNIITGKGPGAAFEFAVAIAAYLGKEPQARSLMKNMFQKI